MADSPFLSSVNQTEYLVFDNVGANPPYRKTDIVNVWSRRSGDLLGQIKWFGRWRQYAFFPEPNTIWNSGCLNDVEAKLVELMAARRG